MDELSKESPYGVEIKVSPDAMVVTLVIRRGSQATAGDILKRIRDLKINRFDEGIVGQTLLRSKSGEVSVELARGSAPVEDQPGVIDYLIPFPPESPTSITKVEVGQAIANVTPTLTGADGCDVFGMRVERSRKNAVQFGRNLTEGGGKLLAQLKGNLRLIGHVLSVEPLLEVRSDPANVAPIVFDGDTIIRGALNEGRSVQVTGCLTVAGAMEAVQLNTGGSVTVQGGVIGNQKGKYMIGGDLRCRFVTGGFIIAGKDVLVQSNISDARIACGGKLQVAQGLIFGGVIAANSGLSCATLGHPGGVPTLIEAGEGIAARSFLATTTARINANQERIKTIRAKIAPLLRIMKTLTAQQREKATELLYEADELEVANLKLTADLKTQTIDLHEKALAEIWVSKIVHPGVTVRFPNAKTVFTDSVKGPFKLVPQEKDGVTRVMLINDADQSVIELPTAVVSTETATGKKAA